MKRVFAVILFLALGWLTAYGQTSNSKAGSGSVYSKLGVGFPVDGGSSGAKGIGLWGVSYEEPFVAGYANPALWGSTVYGMAAGSVSLQSFEASDLENTSANLLFSPNSFQIQLPILRNELGVSATLAPLTRSAFNQIEIRSQIIGTGSARDTLFYQSQNQGGGGINMLELGAGWSINSNIAVGYAASLVFASIDNEHSTIFASNEYNSVGYNIRTSGTGFGNRFGIQLKFPSLLSGGDQINIGASVMLPVKINAERIEEANKALPNGSFQTVVTREGEGLGDGIIELPAIVNAGITYQASRLLSFTTEGLYQNWSGFTYDFNPDEEQIAVDRYKVGMGLRYFPYISGSDKFLSGFKYRVGASYDAGHLKINGQRVETLMFSVGLGILSPSAFRPNSGTASSFDISFEYGIRGTKDQNLVKENIWGLRLSLNLAELFFYRPKLQ